MLTYKDHDVYKAHIPMLSEMELLCLKAREEMDEEVKKYNSLNISIVQLYENIKNIYQKLYLEYNKFLPQLKKLGYLDFNISFAIREIFDHYYLILGTHSGIPMPNDYSKVSLNLTDLNYIIIRKTRSTYRYKSNIFINSEKFNKDKSILREYLKTKKICDLRENRLLERLGENTDLLELFRKQIFAGKADRELEIYIMDAYPEFYEECVVKKYKAESEIFVDSSKYEQRYMQELEPTMFDEYCVRKFNYMLKTGNHLRLTQFEQSYMMNEHSELFGSYIKKLEKDNAEASKKAYVRWYYGWRETILNLLNILSVANSTPGASTLLNFFKYGPKGPKGNINYNSFKMLLLQLERAKFEKDNYSKQARQLITILNRNFGLDFDYFYYNLEKAKAIFAGQTYEFSLPNGERKLVEYDNALCERAQQFLTDNCIPSYGGCYKIIIKALARGEEENLLIQPDATQLNTDDTDSN